MIFSAASVEVNALIVFIVTHAVDILDLGETERVEDISIILRVAITSEDNDILRCWRDMA